MIGELIDHYRVLALIGRGAMGVVYKGIDVNLERPVAIKVMSVEARNDPDFVERFRQEARLQGALNHPNVALLFDYFVHDGAPVAVMEFIDGESLEALIRRRGAIPAREAIPIFRQALRGVAAAHRAGIVHRDLKPSNLMVTAAGIVKVMDFGIAKRQGVTGATKASTSIGSPLYMAPEQILGRAVDCRTDVYGLGITLYELLSGQRPFNPRGKAEYLVLNAHVNDTPEPPTVYRYGIPQPIVDAVMRALAKDPDARFQSADEFMRALPDVLAPPDAVAPQADFTSTVVLEYSPPMSDEPVAAPASAGAPVFGHTPTKRIDPPGSLAFDFSAGTVWQQLHPPASATSPATTASPAVARSVPPPPPPGLMRRLRAHRLGAAIALVMMLGLGGLLRYADRLHAMPASAPATAPATLPAPASAPMAVPALPAPAIPLATAAVPARPDLSGTWRGAYFDASGRELLRIVSLSISQVREDGGIEGTLQYQARSGEGECQLHPRGSTWSAGRQRLQLSPESCSPHYPRELGVPLDFDAVNPEANMLKNGRIEAPTGEMIRVRLKRVSGV